MEQNETQKGITLAELWKVFSEHIWVILVVGLVVFGLVAGYSIINYSAEYTSTATVYLIHQKDNSGTSTPTASDFSLALNTVNDCVRTFKSHRVLDAVISQLGMPITYEQLNQMITIENPQSTRFLAISVTANNPSDAKIIVDKLCEIGEASIVEIMGIDQVNIVDKGTFSQTPSNSMVTLSCFVAGCGAAAAVYVVYLMMHLFDDRISDPDDIEKYFGLSVLGIIPNAVEKQGKKYGKYGGKYTAESEDAEGVQ